MKVLTKIWYVVYFDGVTSNRVSPIYKNKVLSARKRREITSSIEERLHSYYDLGWQWDDVDGNKEALKLPYKPIL